MLDRFYLIVDTSDWLRRLLPCGVKLVQLRIKEGDEAFLRQEISSARNLCKAAGAQLVVNDYWKLAIDTGCDYVHLGQEDMDTADFVAIRKAGMKFGLSTHDESELDRALSFKPDYVALGPVYPTILKKMRFGPQGVERVTQWKKLTGKTTLVAIGGMSVERAPGVFAAGADSISVVTDVLLNKDPEARARQWVAVSRPQT